jgi:hypothetical protein
MISWRIIWTEKAPIGNHEKKEEDSYFLFIACALFALVFRVGYDNY